ncbi:MAG: tetratricopeptide repeat-containing glycosyltransferase [Burkholderiales bacterium]
MGLKIAVYAICRDEAQFVSRFMTNLAEADGVFVTDTGSTDNTRDLLEAHGARVRPAEVTPWRFDTARNLALGFVPSEFDLCFSLDLDEVVSAGWRAEVEKVWRADAHRVRYQYVWNTLPDGRDGVTMWYDRIHRRHGFRWAKPVHEVLQLETGGASEVHVQSHAITVRHYPDTSKPRSSYIPLLEMACREDPEDDRSCHYLGRDYLRAGLYDKAIAELERHLSLKSATWKPERAASMRYIALSYRALDNPAEAQAWALRACAEAPGEREPWVDLATILYAQQNFAGAYFAMKQALDIREKPVSYICEPKSWGGYPYDLAALAAFRLGMKEESLRLCEQAVALEPGDARLGNNLEFLRRAASDVQVSARGDQPQDAL